MQALYIIDQLRTVIYQAIYQAFEECLFVHLPIIPNLQSFDHKAKQLNIILLINIIGTNGVITDIYKHFMYCYKDMIYITS